jgi:Uncharacterized protein conserved in bacteria (DUF2188)
MKPVSPIEWIVGVEGRSLSGRLYEVEEGVALMEAFENLDTEHYPTVATDSERGTIAATLSVEADSADDAFAQASSVFGEAAKKALGEDLQVISVEAKSAEEADRALSEPPTHLDLVGIKEIAEILDVSRQRASELSRHPRFPVPITRLAVGPIWLRSSIANFAAEWERKPGRGLKTKDVEQDSAGGGRHGEATPAVWPLVEGAESPSGTVLFAYGLPGSGKTMVKLEPSRWGDMDDIEADMTYVITPVDRPLELFRCQAETISTTAHTLLEHAQKQQEDLSKFYIGLQDTYGHLFEPPLFDYLSEEEYETSGLAFLEWVDIFTKLVSTPLSYSQMFLKTIEDAQESLVKSLRECGEEVRSMTKRSGGRKSYHVVKNPAGGWSVKGAGAKRASSTHKTQAAAKKAATKQAKSAPKGQVVIHGRDGKIRTEHTYGSDPNPPSG